MDQKKLAALDKKFEALKQKAEKRERTHILYKPVTTLYFEKTLRDVIQGLELRLDKKFVSKEELKSVENKINELHAKFDTLYEKLDWFLGKYTKLDEEQKLISAKVGDHDDRIEIIEKKIGIYAN